jgi:hypothetical protein
MYRSFARYLIASLGIALFVVILVIISLIIWGTARNIRLYALRNPMPVLAKEKNPITHVIGLFRDIFRGRLGSAATAIIDNPIKSVVFLAIIMILGILSFAVLGGIIEDIGGG